jgi:hypothetical protein
MIFIGHFSSVLLASHLLPVQRRTALVASLFPDVLDKTLHWALRVTPSDRLWGHTVWAALGTTALAGCIAKRTGRPALLRSWVVGYGVHLLGDTMAGLPLFYPLSKRGYHHGARFREVAQGERRFPWKVLALEGLLTLAALAAEVLMPRRCGSRH